MKNTTVDLSNPSIYYEPDSKFLRFKRKIILKPILKIIRKYIDSPSLSLLEIGTGAGYLISFLEYEFPQMNLTGLEFDNRLVSLTQSKVKKARILQGNAEEFNFKDETFDIIVSLQVIEHLYRPELMLGAVKKHLNPGGVFIFTTPNLSSVGAKLMKEKWHGYRDDHVSLKGFEEWKCFLEANGFKPMYCETTFFSGIPLLNKIPFGLLNWSLLFFSDP